MKQNFIFGRLSSIAFVLAVGLLGLSVEPGQAAVNAPTNLRCEYLKNPQGIDVSKPRFFWEDRSEARGFRQSAYQIELKRDGQPIWDSGRVISAETIQIEYGGPALEPATRYLSAQRQVYEPALKAISYQLRWPPDHLGWHLETNAVGLTAANAWFPYLGSDTVTNRWVPIGTSGNVFFRLVYP